MPWSSGRRENFPRPWRVRATWCEMLPSGASMSGWIYLSPAATETPAQGGTILIDTVQTLVRVQVGPIHLGDTKPGKWRNLTSAEVGALYAAAEL